MDDFEIYDIDNENYELYLLKKEKNIKKQKRQRKILFKNKKKGHNIIVNSTDKYLLRIFMGYLYELKLQGIIPIIAHPERYSYIQRHPRLINDFINEGCLFQLNAGSITGRHGEKAKESAKELLKNNIYSFIGSDGHNITTRKTEISDSISNIQKINNNFKEEVFENSKKLLVNEEIIFCGKEFEKKKKGMFSFLRKK